MKQRFITPLLALALLSGTALADASYVRREEVRTFVRTMEEKHGFDGGEVLAALDRARHEPDVIRLISPSGSPGVRSWQRYRARFLDSARIGGGVAFWQEHAATLQAAHERYGVPPEIVVAIIGVETHYGRNTGNFETLSALATLAFDYPPRAPLFLRELENLFLLAREQQRDLFSYYGSYAGAIGYPQFLPSSIRSYGVDFDHSGTIDFDLEPTDAIGSVARYLAEHGWVRDELVAEPARIASEADLQALIDAGIKPMLSPEQLAQAGVTSLDGTLRAAPATLVDLATPDTGTEYWLGYQNFYTITRYNKSSFYAMAVFELSQALREQQKAETARVE
ncbi:lytic murein transglycosylase B [Aromatoleum aromaticum]|uniref:lytic murein transglycosylase B n=1 Tax=Aromatoleum aromaticum TaxID=551760 RepID=UPI0014592DEC|nr:lytic murein transglycosylase B [Aromatoleum aromaticum]NMG55780.1 lytic murein transglycosylase B [Aromatoleum aromaticum]